MFRAQYVEQLRAHFKRGLKMFKSFLSIPISRVVMTNSRQVLRGRCLHLSSVNRVKKYSSSEASFGDKFLQNHAFQEKRKQSDEKLSLEEIVSGKSNEELVDGFEALSYYCVDTETEISHDNYDEFIDKFLHAIPNFSDEQIMKVLADFQRFPQTENIRSKNFIELREALDDMCCERLKDWKVPQILKVAHLWYKLHLGKIGKFTWKGLVKISRRFRKLTAKELVDTMFYLTVCRTQLNDMIDAEMRMLDVIDQLNIDEIGIICLAFFKTETKMKTRELIEKIYDRSIESAADMHEVTVSSITKTLRYSSDPTHFPKMPILSDAFLPHIEKYHILALLHIGLLGTNLQYCHQELFEKIVTKFNENVSDIRLKDIERIAFATGLFDFRTESGVEKELLSKIACELKTRVKEIMAFPRCLASSAHYLSIMGVYDEDIINSVLNDEYIDFAYGKNHMKIGREVLCLDSFAKINLRSTYKGSQLSDKKRGQIARYQTAFVPRRNENYKLTHYDKLMLNIQEFFEAQYGPSEIRHILPHYERPDIIFCFNENGNPVTEEIVELFPAHYKGDIISKEFLFGKKPELAKKYQMVAIVVGGWNFFVRGSEKPTGGLRLKLEQLEMIGYKPLLIHFNRWITMSADEKEKFVGSEIKGILNSV